MTDYRWGKDKPACLVIFLDAERGCPTVAKLLANLLRQAVQQKKSLSRSMRNAFDLHRNDQRLPEDECLSLLKTEVMLLLRSFPGVFIMVDALDEHLGLLREFLHALFQLPPKVKYFFTSKNLSSIASVLQPDFRIQIDAQDDDLRRYVQRRLEALPRLKELVDKENRESLCKTVVAKAKKT